MATNPLGAGTQNVTVNMPDHLKTSLKALAKRSGMSLGLYIRTVLEEATEEQVLYKTKVEKVTSAPQEGVPSTLNT